MNGCPPLKLLYVPKNSTSPIATKIYFYAGIETLGFFNNERFVASDIFAQTSQPAAKPSVTLATQTVMQTFFMRPKGLIVPIEQLSLSQRPKSSAFGALNTVVFGSAAILALLARRSLQRQHGASPA